jgi:hypothetical protein
VINGHMKVGGLVTFWQIAEWTEHALLQAGLTDAGFGDFVPPTRAPVTALKDALTDVLGGPRVLVRPLSKDGFVVVREDRGEEDNQYTTLMQAKVGDNVILYKPLNDKALAVTESYNRHIGYVSAGSVAGCLVKIMDSLGKTTLRESGGLYWLPDSQLSKWEAVAKATEAAVAKGNTRIYFLRHLMDADACRAIRDAVQTEILAEAQRLEAELMDSTVELGERALSHRGRLCIDLKARIVSFEELLGESLASLRQAVDGVETALAAAALRDLETVGVS